MIELDKSNLGGCQGQYWLTRTVGRTVVFQKVSRIFPVDHPVNIHTSREGGGATGRQKPVYKVAQGRSMGRWQFG